MEKGVRGVKGWRQRKGHRQADTETGDTGVIRRRDKHRDKRQKRSDEAKRG